MAIAKLFWLQPDSTIIEFPLAAAQNVIGRGSRTDIRIKHPGISSEHALIRVADNVATLEDLDSTNGTRVNGRAIKRHTLRHGDQIEVGRERLMYFAELDSASRFAQPVPDEPFSEPASQAERVATRAGVAAGAAVATAGATLGAAGAAAAPPSAAVGVAKQQAAYVEMGHADPLDAVAREVKFSGSVVVLSGANTGKRFPLDKEEVTLGREGRQVIAIRRVDNNRWTLELKNGAAPPYINGDAILSPKVLVSGDVIELIGIKLRFEMSMSD